MTKKVQHTGVIREYDRHSPSVKVGYGFIIALCLIAPRDLNAAQVINVLVVLLIGSVFILCWTAEGKPENKNRS